MKILIDTNVLISTALFPDSFAAKAYEMIIKNPENVIICDYELDEMRSVFTRKFPDKINELNEFLICLEETVSIVKVPQGISPFDIRDVNDEPILRTAISHKADLILTGDKDFAAVIMEKPLVMTPREFCEQYLP